MSASLLSTKFYIPHARADGVSRPRLTEKLLASLNQPGCFALLSGPAGFGKTTLLSEFVTQLRRPVGWVSLDEGDNDPIRFWTYLIAACQSVQEEIGKSALALFHTPQPLPDDTIPTILINDLARLDCDIVLVLDDYHVINNPSIDGGLSFLLVHLPEKLHIILSTRVDPPWPLARFRARNQLIELRAVDLRFTIGEAAAFLNQMMGLNLSAEDVAALEARTEGWIAGLQLAALSMKGRSDLAGFVKAFTGSHVYVAEYLVEEVLRHQPEEVQTFLLQTSILERLNATLCEAVTGRPDGQAILMRLQRTNLFVVPLDDEGQWFRYHHLFADLLKARLRQAFPAEAIATLHRRASRWFAQAVQESGLGERAALVSQAIEHALAAADYAYAVQLIEAYAAEIMNQWYIQTVQDWLRLLPAEWSAQSPKTNLAFARLHMTRGDFSQAAPYLERLEAMFADPQTGERDVPFSSALMADWLALQAIVLNAQGKPGKALELARQALEKSPEKDLDTRSRVYLALATAYQQLDEPERATEAYQQIIHLGRSAANIVIELLGISALALMVIERGQLRYGFELAAQGIERLELADVLSPICAGLYGELGQVSFHWGHLDQAERYLKRAAQVSALGGFSDAEVFYAIARSRICHMRGDLDAAEQEIGAALQGMRTEAPLVVREEVVAQQVNVLLARQNLAAAEHTLAQANDREKLPDLEPGQNLTYPQGLLYNCALRIQLQRARLGSKPAASPNGLDLAGRLLTALLHRQYIPLALETLLLRAQLHTVLGNPQAGQADLAAALDLAEPEGFLSVFVMEGRPIAEFLARLYEHTEPRSSRAQFIPKILDVFSSGQGLSPAPPIERPAGNQDMVLCDPLTERELDVLRLMKEGQTYAEIAGRLVVSINTVRSHVKSIYGKLGSNNRTAALEAARQMKLL